jgi:hypothetical protein
MSPTAIIVLVALGTAVGFIAGCLFSKAPPYPPDDD